MTPTPCYRMWDNDGRRGVQQVHAPPRCRARGRRLQSGLASAGSGCLQRRGLNNENRVLGDKRGSGGLGLVPHASVVSTVNGSVKPLGFQGSQTQRAQCPLIKEYSLKHNWDPLIIEAIFLN